MASNILLLDTASSFQHRGFVDTTENKENGGEENSTLELNISDMSLDESNALRTWYENGQNIMAMCENEKHSYNSDVSSVSCDMCGKHFKSIYYLKVHHFICMEDKQIEYTDCDKPFSNDDAFKIHMCKHLCLNGTPGKLHPSLISETNVHLNEKSDSFVSENHFEVVKNGGCGGSVAGDDVLLSENVSNRNGILEHNIVESVMKGMKNSNIKNVIDSSNEEKPISDISPVIDPSVLELVCGMCNVLDVVQDVCDKKFKCPSNPDAHHHTRSNDKSYCFSESDGRFSESLNGHLGIYRRKKHDMHNRESRIILSKQKKMRICDIQNTEIKNVCYNNDEKSVDDNSSVTKPSVSEFACDTCGQKFTSQSNLNTHSYTHTNDKLYNCTECGKHFSRNSNLKRHVRIHTRKKHDIHDRESRIILSKQKKMRICDIQNTEIKNVCYNNDEKSVDDNSSVTKPSVSEFACDICGQKFTSQSNLNTHSYTHTNDKLYNCTECGKHFSRNDNFKRHVRIHTRKKPDRRKQYTCKVCLKSFAWQTRLNVHLRIHTNAREFRCTLCGKGFNQNATLTSHMLTHSGEKPHKCSICSKRFAMKNSLRRHLQRHSGDKPHQCDVCFFRFPFFGDLKEHYRKHTGELPFECDICKKRFRRRCGLNAHIAAHTGNQPHKCDICQRKFFHKYALIAHRKVHTKDKIFACNICDKSFTTNSGLKKHRQVHTGEKPFVCSYCNKAFANRGAHDRHIWIHTGTQPYECKICKRLFNQKTSLQRHQVVHTKEKPYSCDICKKCFTQKSYLSTHKLTHSKEKS